LAESNSNTISTVVAQVDGDHYDQDDFARCPHCGGKIQHWDMFGMAHGLIYAATKYLTRLGRKPGEEQLVGCEKAISYIQKYMRVLEAKFMRDKLKNAGIPAERVINAPFMSRSKRRNQSK